MYSKKYLSRSISVLMLDNEEKLLTVIKSYFSLKNIDIATTSQVTKALNLLSTKLPDCIVIDIAMPNNIGLQFIQEIQQNANYKSIPFILLTTKGLTEDRIKGYKLGCNAYISKPFDPEELEAIIKNIVLKRNEFYEFILETYLFIKDIRMQLSISHKNYHFSELPLLLTNKEQFILRQILLGKRAIEIASDLGVSLRAIEKYITRILNKTKSKNIQELKTFSCLFF